MADLAAALAVGARLFAGRPLKDVFGAWILLVASLFLVGLMVRWLVRSLRASRRSLAEREQAATATTDFARRALASRHLHEVIADATRTAAATLRADRAGFLTFDEETRSFRGAAGIGWATTEHANLVLPATADSLPG